MKNTKLNHQPRVDFLSLTWEFVEKLKAQHSKYWLGYLNIEPFIHVKYTIIICKNNQLELRYWKNNKGIFLRYVDSVEAGAEYAQKHLNNILLKSIKHIYI